MPLTKQMPLIRTRLRADDLARFDRICRLEGKKQSEIARQALIQYLDNYDKGLQSGRDDAVIAEIRRQTNRLAKMIARGNIDTGVIYAALYNNLPPETRDKRYAAYYKQSVTRLEKKKKEQSAQAEVRSLAEEPFAAQGKAGPAESSTA